MSRVLLDTNCAAGFISGVLGKNNGWVESIQEIIDEIDENDVEIIIPTPACMELARRDGKWHKVITNPKPVKGLEKLLAFAKYSITPDIFYGASKYLLFCGGRQAGSKKHKDKISFVDALVASYSLTYNYYIVTMNQQDFSPKYFQSLAILESPRKSQNSERQAVWLLQPQKSIWDNEKIRDD